MKKIINFSFILLTLALQQSHAAEHSSKSSNYQQFRAQFGSPVKPLDLAKLYERSNRMGTYDGPVPYGTQALEQDLRGKAKHIFDELKSIFAMNPPVHSAISNVRRSLLPGQSPVRIGKSKQNPQERFLQALSAAAAAEKLQDQRESIAPQVRNIRRKIESDPQFAKENLHPLEDMFAALPARAALPIVPLAPSSSASWPSSSALSLVSVPAPAPIAPVALPAPLAPAPLAPAAMPSHPARHVASYGKVNKQISRHKRFDDQLKKNRKQLAQAAAAPDQTAITQFFH